MRTALLAALAGFAAGVAAAALVVGAAAAGGAFGASTTVVRDAPAAAVPIAAPAVARAAGGLDAAALYRDRSPGVVTIEATLPDGDQITGSGFVVSRRGIVMTNAHVVTTSGSSGVQAADVAPAQHVYVQFAD